MDFFGSSAGTTTPSQPSGLPTGSTCLPKREMKDVTASSLFGRFTLAEGTRICLELRVVVTPVLAIFTKIQNLANYGFAEF